MVTTTFDTLKFVDRLKASGIREEQARALAQAQRDAFAETIQISKLATKKDIERAKSDIIKWVAGLLIAQAALTAALVKLL